MLQNYPEISGPQIVIRAVRNHGITMLLDLSMFHGHREQTIDHVRPPVPTKRMPAAPTGIRRFKLNYTSERRRIVAQVRRKARKNNGFFAPQNNFTGCDDLLTLGVDKVDGAGL
jgi:hypothetical protein